MYEIDTSYSLLQVPQSTCSSNCGAGQVRRVKGFHSCCFDCIDCMAGTFQAINGKLQAYGYELYSNDSSNRFLLSLEVP